MTARYACALSLLIRPQKYPCAGDGSVTTRSYNQNHPSATLFVNAPRYSPNRGIKQQGRRKHRQRSIVEDITAEKHLPAGAHRPLRGYPAARFEGSRSATRPLAASERSTCTPSGCSDSSRSVAGTAPYGESRIAATAALHHTAPSAACEQRSHLIPGHTDRDC